MKNKTQQEQTERTKTEKKNIRFLRYLLFKLRCRALPDPLAVVREAPDPHYVNRRFKGQSNGEGLFLAWDQSPICRLNNLTAYFQLGCVGAYQSASSPSRMKPITTARFPRHLSSPTNLTEAL